MQRSSVRMLALAGTTIVAVGCGGAARQASAEAVQPAARIEAGPTVAPDTGRAPRRRANEADVRFMRGMIGHHAQAVRMTDLVPTRAARPEIRLMAERIAVSQQDEIAAMERWLRSRGEEVPSADAHQHHGAAGGDHAGMPGMATPEEMARLAASTGAEFDRLFLELMIRHHEGALVMVAALLAAPGGGQDAEVYQLASDVEADQRAEIARMRRLQNGPAPAAPRR
jgi:uncharacterized protein (DUF305 family)